MNAQSTLTLIIEVYFWVSVTFMIFQFIAGAFIFAAQTNNMISVANNEVITPVGAEIVIASEAFERIPDPWMSKSKVAYSISNEAVTPFPTLRLLPPAKEQKVHKHTTDSTKKTVALKKSTKNIEAAVPIAKRKPGRPRKKAA